MNAIIFYVPGKIHAKLLMLTLGVYDFLQNLVTGGFEEEVIRDHVVMSCVSSRLRLRRLWVKDLSLSLFLSLELLQAIARTMQLSDHEASKRET